MTPSRAIWISAPNTRATLRAFGAADEIFAASAGSSARVAAVLAQRLCVWLGDGCVVSLAAADGQQVQPVAVAHRDISARRALEQLRRSDPRALVCAFTRRALDSGGSVRMPIVTADLLRLWTPPAFWGYLDRHPVASVLVAALPFDDRVVGVVRMWREAPNPGFTNADEAFLASLAPRLAVGLASPPDRR